MNTERECSPVLEERCSFSTEDVASAPGHSPIFTSRAGLVPTNLGSTPERRSDLRPARWKLVRVGGQQLDERRDLVEARPARNRLRIGVPLDEARLVELREMDVVQPRHDILASLVVGEIRRGELGYVSWVCVDKRRQDAAPRGLAEYFEELVERGTLPLNSLIAWRMVGHMIAKDQMRFSNRPI